MMIDMMTNFEFQAITLSKNPSPVNYDVVVVGGGISGLMLACGLQSSGLRILVVEAQQEQQATERSLCYALLPLTSKIFRGLGLWEQIAPQITHFSHVLLSDADYPHWVEFCPYHWQFVSRYPVSSFVVTTVYSRLLGRWLIAAFA